MKKILSVLLALILCLALCACDNTMTADESGANVDGWGPYVYICNTDGDYSDPFSNGYWLGYHRDTHIIYECFALGTNLGTVTLYQMYVNGAIYGAVYENNEIVPVPYAMGITEEMIDEYFNQLFK